MTTGGYVTDHDRARLGSHAASDSNYDIVLAVASPAFSCGLRTLLGDATGVLRIYESKDATSTAELLAQSRNAVVLIDNHSRPLMSELRRMSVRDAHRIAVRAVVLFANIDPGALVTAVRVGVRGAVLREGPIDELLAAISGAAMGRRFVSADLVTSLLDELTEVESPTLERSPNLRAPLTRREADVLTLLTDGHGNAEMAGRLNIETTTVKYHVSNIMRKLGASDRSHAIVLAYRLGLAPTH